MTIQLRQEIDHIKEIIELTTGDNALTVLDDMVCELAADVDWGLILTALEAQLKASQIGQKAEEGRSRYSTSSGAAAIWTRR